MPIYSLELEKQVLSGIIKHQQVFSDISAFLKETDFYDQAHSTIFLVIKSLFERNEKWDKVILAEKIKNLGISFKKDNFNIYDYIDNLSYLPITSQEVLNATKELIKVRVRRDIENIASEMQKFVSHKGNLSLDQIISGIDAIYGKKVDIVDLHDQPVNLFEGIKERIEKLGENPVDEIGLRTPYDEFNRLYGGLRPSNVYAFASRPGQGKTSILNDLALKSCQINDTKAFICDTEMPTEDIQTRMVASLSGVGEWYITTGNWRKNASMIERVRAAYKQLEDNNKKNYITHFHIGNKNLDQVISAIRRWKAKNIINNKPFIVVYDYLKLTAGESVDNNEKEYQALGKKVDRLKRLAEELNCIILTAVQLNRSGEGSNKRNGDFSDDSSAFAQTDRLQWFAAFTCIFRRKTLDEINRDGTEFGTHMLIPTKTRYQGRDAAGHFDLVRRQDEKGDVKWVSNYLNFSIADFNVRELGSLRSMLAVQNSTSVPEQRNPGDGETL